MRRLLVSAALGAALVAGGAGAATPRPATLVTAPGRIAGVAQDGPRVLWGYIVPNSSTCLDAVRVHNFANGTETDLTHPSRAGCGIDNPFGAGNEAFALAGRRALWTVHEYGNFTYVDLVTGTSGGSDRFLGQIVYDNADGDGDHFTGAAGDGPTLVYSWVELVPNLDCVEHPECELYVRGGGVQRIIGARQPRLPNAPPATAVAAFGSRIALAVAPLGGRWRDLGPTRRIELRTVPGGVLAGSFAVHGRVRGLALTGRAVAVLLKSGTAQRIEIYSRATRLLVRSVRVPRKTAPPISFSGRTVVFHAGRTIYALDIASGRVRPIAQAERPPIGLTIEGTRVAWAENFPAGRGDSRGRLKTLTLR